MIAIHAHDPRFRAMMKMFVKVKEFVFFYDQALRSDHTYHKVRKDLWDSFLAAFSTVPVPKSVKITPNTFNQIKSYLCSRNDSTNSDDKRLAFETSIQNLREVVSNEVVVKPREIESKVLYMSTHGSKLSPIKNGLDRISLAFDDEEIADLSSDEEEGSSVGKARVGLPKSHSAPASPEQKLRSKREVPPHALPL